MKIPQRKHVPSASESAPIYSNTHGDLNPPNPTDADRIALNNMFKAIAEYGRRVRLRRQSEGALPVAETPKAGEG